MPLTPSPRIRGALLAGLVVSSGVAAADEPGPAVRSWWQGPVSTHLCAPLSSCASLADDYGPLLGYPMLLDRPDLLRDVMVLLEHPELVGPDPGPDAVLALGSGLLANPEAVSELLQLYPDLLLDLHALPGQRIAFTDQGPPDHLVELLEGVFDVTSPAGGMTALASADGSVVVMRGRLAGHGDDGDGEGTARAVVLVDVAAFGNRLEEHAATSRSSISQSFQGDLGVINANQSSGHLNTQANVRAFAFGRAGSGAALSITPRRSDTTIVATGGARRTRLVDSFQGSAGLVGVNQSAGNLNQQVNAVALAIGLDVEGVSPVLGDAELSAIGGAGRRTGERGPRADVIDGSFGGFGGVAQVSQSSGDGNVITNALSASFKVMP